MSSGVEPPDHRGYQKPTPTALNESSIALQIPSEGPLLQKSKAGSWKNFIFIITFQWAGAYFSSIKMRAQIIHQLSEHYDPATVDLIKQHFNKWDYEKIAYFKTLMPFVDAQEIPDILESLNSDAKKTLQVVKLLFIANQFLNESLSHKEAIRNWLLKNTQPHFLAQFIYFIRQAINRNPRITQLAQELKEVKGITENVIEFIDKLQRASLL